MKSLPEAARMHGNELAVATNNPSLKQPTRIDEKSANPEFEYDVFLCHNGADKNWVRELGAQLESETIDGTPDSRKIRVFFDEWDIDIGENFIARINDGLRSSRYVACILSPEFMSAPWPTFEWTHVVATDPINAKKRLVPILFRDSSLDGAAAIDLCAPFRSGNYIDFRKSSEFKKGFQRLVRKIRGLPPQRGGSRKPIAGVAPLLVSDEQDDSSQPDLVPDALLGNLLPVQSVPNFLWGASTTCRKPQDVFDKVSNAEPFILRDKMLYTFSDLRQQETQLSNVIERGSVEKHSTHEWLLDADKSRNFMDLLQRCLISHSRKLGIKQDKKKRFFFRPDNGGKRVWANKGDRAREVAAPKTNERGESFWVHHAAKMRFRRLGQKFFLCIEPIYLFTTDGDNPIDGKAAGKLAMAWGGKQQNDMALRNLIFWAKALSKSMLSNAESFIQITSGGSPIKVRILPSMVKMAVGIDFDAVKVGAILNQVDLDLELVANDVVFTRAESEQDDTDEE